MVQNNSTVFDAETYRIYALTPSRCEFSFWSAAASTLVELLSDPSNDAFLLHDITAANSTMGILDFAYVYHPRLHIFYIVQMIFTAAVAIASALIITAACRSRTIFLRSGMTPRRCASCCVALVLMIIVLVANLIIMFGCYSGMLRGLRQLPQVYACAIADLRLFVNRTINEMYYEIEKGEHWTSLMVQSLASGALQEMPPRVTMVNHRLVICRNETTSIWEVLDKLRRRALISIDQMEKSAHEFDRGTAFWTHAKLLGFDIIPLAFIVLGIIVVLMGLAVGYAARNYVYWFMPSSSATKHTAVLILATAAVIVVFYLLASVLVVVMVTAGFLGDHYICKPYREGAYQRLHDLYLMSWCRGGQGELFSGLTPHQVLSKCKANGTSFAALDPYWNVSREGQVLTNKVKSRTLHVSLTNVTIGNCRPIYDIIRITTDTFCDVFLDGMLGVTLSLAVNMVVLLCVLPLLLVLSQHFPMEVHEDDVSTGDNDMPFEPENSQEELVSGDNKAHQIYHAEGRTSTAKSVPKMKRKWFPSRQRMFKTKHIQERPLISKELCPSPPKKPRTTFEEMFPHVTSLPQVRTTRRVVCRKTSRKTSLMTIEEEPESGESS